MRLTMLAVAATVGVFGHAEARDSARDILPGCRDYVSVGKGVLAPERADVLAAADCVATIRTLFNVSELLGAQFRFCRPDGVTLNNGVELAVQAIEARPQMGDRPFVIMAMAAFRERWPCR